MQARASSTTLFHRGGSGESNLASAEPLAIDRIDPAVVRESQSSKHYQSRRCRALGKGVEIGEVETREMSC